MNVFDRIEELRRQGRPFCIATVVRTADATSAKAGAKAVVTSDGEIQGHLGGACVQGAVRKAAAETLASGGTTLIRVKPSDKVVSLVDPDGALAFKSGCPSGGTVDILIETCTPPPVLVVFGATPIADAIAAHASLAGFRVTAVPDADTDLPAVTAGDFVVVASQGKGDLACLRTALQAPCRRVSMIASRKKAAALTEKLVQEGLPAERCAALKSPAGLDLQAVDPHEIAIAVLAEIIRWRRTAQAADANRTRHGEAGS
jgi:xanthine dehydrogenase accessory factor